MKKKILLIISVVVLSMLALCSCSRNSMRRAENDVKDTARRGKNAIENGIDAFDGDMYNGMNGYYGANSGYSGNAATGTGYSVNPNDDTARRRTSDRMERNRRDDKDGKGEVNSNDGRADGGKGHNNNR